MRRTKEQISFNMSRIRSRGSIIERTLARDLKKNKIKYRSHPTIYGKPDFSILGPRKILVFCDSAFWHGYRNMSTVRHDFKRNKNFWIKKIKRNIERDKQVNQYLRGEGWKIVRFWDFQITKNLEQCIGKIKCLLSQK